MPGEHCRPRLSTCAAQITGFNINFFNASDFLYPAPSTSFVFGPPGKRLPFPDQTFDLVMSMNVLEHVAGACSLLELLTLQ